MSGSGAPAITLEHVEMVMSLTNDMFLKRLRLAPKVKVTKFAAEMLQNILNTNDPSVNSPYLVKRLGKDWREAIVARCGPSHDTTKWDKVVALEWRRLGVKDYSTAKKVELCMYYACCARFINISNLHLRSWFKVG